MQLEQQEAQQDFGSPSDSYLFLQALRKAKEESMKEFQQVDEGRQRLEKRVAKFDLLVNPDTDDTGDCQFDATADQLNLLAPAEDARIDKEEVRRRVIEWLKSNGEYRLSEEEGCEDTLQTWVRDTQGMEWPEYLEHMAQPKVWGDEVTLRGLVEAFQVEILVFSSTVSEENYFSQHKPRGQASRRRLLLCHFLEIHYGSLLSEAQFREREASKRRELLRCLRLCDAREQQALMENVFTKDNFHPESSAPLITLRMVSKALAGAQGDVGAAFQRLAELAGPRLRLKPERVAQARAAAEKQRAAPADGELQRLRLRNAELEEQLAKALSLIDSLRGEQEEPQERREEDRLAASYLLDEDGKYWINVEWDLTEAAMPRAGDMLSLCLDGSEKPVQRLPTTGSGQRGAALFDVPKKIGRYVARYSRRGKLIAQSPSFLAGPDVRLRAECEGGELRVLHEMARGASSPYDWVGLYKENAPVASYETYHYVKPSRSHVTFRGLKPGTYTVRYFSGESKYTPVAEMTVTL